MTQLSKVWTALVLIHIEDKLPSLGGAGSVMFHIICLYVRLSVRL